MNLHFDDNGRLRDNQNRFAKNPFDDLNEAVTTNGQAVEPPRLYESVAEVMRGYIRLIAGVLLNSDVSYRRNRSLQKMMRHDPDVMGPLMQREMAISLLEWNIIAEDQNDKEQVEQAAKIQKVIRSNMPRLTDFLLRLADALWYGPAAVNVIYSRVANGMTAPTNWMPFHSDSLIFTETGHLGMKVGNRYGSGDVIPSWDGLAHLFTDEERRAVVLHTYQQQGPDYDEFAEGRYHFAGRGLRDTVWFQWMMKQKALQYWMKFIERYGMGIRILRYPSGNATAQSEMIAIGKNLLQDVTVTLPDNSPPDSGGHSQYGIEILDPGKGGSGGKLFADLIEGYLAGQIKELIIGQTATTEATASGLGSDVGTRHAETFNRIVRFDALALADTLSSEFVFEINRMNFGDTPHRPRWRFALEDVDSEKFMLGVKDYISVGGRVAQRQVREQLGFEEPGKGEDVLQLQDFKPGIGGGIPGGDNTGGGPGDQTAEQATDRSAVATALTGESVGGGRNSPRRSR